MTRKVFSVAYVLDDQGVWLGLKKWRQQLKRRRGQLGIGLYNGFGGRKKIGEPIEITAKREAEEESGFEVLKLKKCGLALIRHDYDEAEVELHFFLVTRFRGTAKESDEMIPRLFGCNEIPYDKMWPNDMYTLPLFLSGELCVALFTINRERILAVPSIVKVVAALPKTVAWESF